MGDTEMYKGNLVANPTFEHGPENDGWTLSGAGVIQPTPAAGPAEERGRRIVSDGTRKVTLSQDVTVMPGTQYFFSARVRGDDRVVARLLNLRMSYTEFGEWQQLAGTIRTVNETNVTIRFEVGGYTGQPNAIWIDEVVLRPTAMPLPPARPQHGATRFADPRTPAAVVYPSAIPAYRAHAEAVQAALREKTGVDVPLVSDVEATAVDRPVLKPEYRDANLILLGRLGINRAIWTPYNRFLCAVDGYYPGGDGYVVRTAANVLRNGRNHIIVGGSSEAGAARGVRRLVEIIEKTDGSSQDGISLPWLLDIELEGACRAAFEARNQLWEDDPIGPMLPMVESGYGSVIRWYENAMSWYWTGWDGYRNRARELIEPVLADDAYTHQYVVEFFVRTYAMIDDSDLLTERQRAGVDRLILKNFWEFLFGVDGNWMKAFSQPYDNIHLTNRHAVAPWIADLIMADFLHDHFALEGDLYDVVAFRRHEKRRFWDYMVDERWGASVPPIGADHDTEITETLFRYALENDRYAFFERGNARRALRLERLNHVRGVWIYPGGACDHELMLGILANYYGEGAYKTLREEVPLVEHPKGPFMMRYVCSTHKYAPGPELAAAPPDRFAGVRLSPRMAHDDVEIAGLKVGRFLRPGNPDDILDFVSFRSGFGPDDDYVALGGIAGSSPPGVFLTFISQGAHWFGAGISGAFSPASDRYFDQNAVDVQRTDRWLTDERPYAGAAQHNWVADLGTAGGASMTMDPFMETSWQRDLVWVRPGLYVVRDTVIAKNEGEFQVAIHWRPSGARAWDGEALACATDKGMLRITPLGPAFEVRQNFDQDRGPDEEAYFRQVLSAVLQPGEGGTATSVLQARKSRTDAVCRARQVDPDIIVLEWENGEEGPISVLWGPVDRDGVQSDASVLVLAADEILALDATSVRVDGQDILAGGERVSRRLPVSGATSLAAKIDVLAAMPAMPSDASGRRAPLIAADRTGGWREAWTYTGLQRPRCLRHAKPLGEEVVDLGADIELAEIRAINTSQRFFFVMRLPEEIWTATDDGTGAPAADSPRWKKLDAPVQWRPTVETGNYGRADPTAEGYQVVQPMNLRARYVRAEKARDLFYYDGGDLRSRRPLRIESGDFNRDGEHQVFVATDTWPPFIKRHDRIDDSLAVLAGDGRELLQFHEPTTMQAAHVLDIDGSGQRKVVELGVDARIRIFATDGILEKTVDLYAMHEQFQKSHGRETTRHPAGGYTMPYDIGLWRPDADGRRKMAITRYGTMVFLDEDQAFEGLLATGGYTNARLLPHGMDFDGDGVEEQLVLNCGRIFPIRGTNQPVIHDPDGDYYYPQVYSGDYCNEPDSEFKIDGARPYQFHGIAWGNGNRYVLIVRESYLGIYDGAENRFAFTWLPNVKLAAAAAIEGGTDSLRVLAQTRDDLLWDLAWRGSLHEPAAFRTRPLDSRINRIVPYPAQSGSVVLAGNNGLYLMRGWESLDRIAHGAFNDACVMEDTDIVAVTRDGRVIRYQAP